MNVDKDIRKEIVTDNQFQPGITYPYELFIIIFFFIE